MLSLLNKKYIKKGTEHYQMTFWTQTEYGYFRELQKYFFF